MSNTNMTAVAVILVLGLLVGAGVGYYMAPEGGTVPGDSTSTPPPTVITVSRMEVPWWLTTFVAVNSALAINNWALSTKAHQKAKKALEALGLL